MLEPPAIACLEGNERNKRVKQYTKIINQKGTRTEPSIKYCTPIIVGTPLFFDHRVRIIFKLYSTKNTASRSSVHPSPI